MRLRLLLILLCVSVLCLGRLSETAAKHLKAEKPMKVLFIGNSYTMANNLPALVAALAEAGGSRRIETAAVLKGGVTLQRHIKETGALDKIAGQPWDFVVLQEQSAQPIDDPTPMHAAAKTLNESIAKRGAKTVFYLTWARQDKPETQDALNRAYFSIAKQLDAEVAPVGLAWRNALASEKNLKLHTADKSHPTPEGSYLAACVFYATLLDKSPEGLPATLRKGDRELIRIDAELAVRLQRIAWDTVHDVKDKTPKSRWAWE